MPSPERTGGFPHLGNQTEADALRSALKEIIPEEFFEQAEARVSQSLDEWGGLGVAFAGRPPALSEEQRQKLARLYQEDESMTTTALGEQFGIHQSTVSRILKNADVPRRHWGWQNVRTQKDIPLDEIIERYEAGETLRALGETYGVSHETIRTRLVEAGIKRRTPDGSYNESPHNN